MSSGTVMKVYKDLPGWGKGVSVLIVLAAAGFAAYKIYSAVNEYISDANARKEGKEGEKELKNLAGAGVKPTLTKSQLTTMANQLETAFLGYGTDAQAVKRVMDQLNNDADALSLSSAYGIRTIKSGSWNPAPDFSGTLAQALIEELSTVEVRWINDSLAKKGITYKI